MQVASVHASRAAVALSNREVSWALALWSSTSEPRQRGSGASHSCYPNNQNGYMWATHKSRTLCGSWKANMEKGNPSLALVRISIAGVAPALFFGFGIEYLRNGNPGIAAIGVCFLVYILALIGIFSERLIPTFFSKFPWTGMVLVVGLWVVWMSLGLRAVSVNYFYVWCCSAVFYSSFLFALREARGGRVSLRNLLIWISGLSISFALLRAM